jgi:hypothetical protein
MSLTERISHYRFSGSYAKSKLQAAPCPANVIPRNVVGVLVREGSLDTASNGFLVLNSAGQRPISNTNTATRGHAICITTASSPQGVDTGGSNCSSAVELRIVISTSWSGTLPDGKSIAATTSLPIIQMISASSGGGGGAVNYHPLGGVSGTTALTATSPIYDSWSMTLTGATTLTFSGGTTGELLSLANLSARHSSDVDPSC